MIPPDEIEVKVVENPDDVVHITLPASPAGDMDLSDDELRNAAGGWPVMDNRLCFLDQGSLRMASAGHALMRQVFPEAAGRHSTTRKAAISSLAPRLPGFVSSHREYRAWNSRYDTILTARPGVASPTSPLNRPLPTPRTLFHPPRARSIPCHR